MACCSSKPAGNYYRYPLKQNRNSNIEIIFHLELKVIMNSMIYFDISRQGDPSKILCFIPTTFRKDVQYMKRSTMGADVPDLKFYMIHPNLYG
jgi:hypothetical protein